MTFGLSLGNAVAGGVNAVGQALGNIGSATRGNASARAGTAGRNYQDVLDQAQRLGFDMNELADAAAQRAQADTRFQQSVGMENLAFSRGLNADQMRQNTYNNMAQNEQQNRFNAAQGLVDAYNQARQSTQNLMANTLRF